MNNTKTYVALIVIAIFTIGAYIFPTNKTVVERVVEQLGAAGPDSLAHSTFYEGLTVGGSFATTTAASFTVRASEFEITNAYTVTPTGAVTLTLPASSTIGMINNPGMTRWMYVKNGASTAGRNITLAGNTGTIIRGNNGTSTVLYTGMGAWLVWYRSATSSPLGDVYVTVIPE